MADDEVIVVGWDPASPDHIVLCLGNGLGTNAIGNLRLAFERATVATGQFATGVMKLIEEQEKIETTRIALGQMTNELGLLDFLPPSPRLFSDHLPESYDPADFTDNGWGSEKWRRQEDERVDAVSLKKRGPPMSCVVRGQKSWPIRPRRMGRGR